MTRWLVAYDGSKDADIAAHCAVDLMDKQKDELILFTAFEDVIQPWVFPYGSSAIPILLESQRNMESEFKKKAADMVSKCKQQGVINCVALCKSGPHAGELICEAVNDMEVDHLVVGRKSNIGGFERFVIGSNSRYPLYCTFLLTRVNILR